jgi:hypothetical protein
MPAAVTAAVRYATVRSTRAQLLAAQAEWDVRLAPLFARQQAMTGILSASNAVSVTLSSSVSSRERGDLEREAATASVNVSVAVVPASQLRISARSKPSTCDPFKSKEAYCSKTITSGVLITPEPNAKPTLYCTAGPMAIPKEKPKKLETYLLTAGHCILEATNEPWYSSTQKGVETKEIGSKTELVLGEKGDYGDILIKPPPGFWLEPGLTPAFPGVVKWSAKEEKALPIEGEEASFENLDNCHQGATSGEQCGIVKAINQTFTYKVGTGAREKEVTVKGLVKDEACGEGGDSGGPWINVTGGGEIRADGTEAAGPPEKCVGHTCLKCESYYEPIKTSLEGLGLELLTTANETRPKPHLPTFLLLTEGKLPVELKGESKTVKVKLETKLGELTGEGLLIQLHWTNLNSGSLGPASLLFTNVQEKTVKCNTEKDGTGLALIDNAVWHLVYISLSPLQVGLLLLIPSFKITCGAIKATITGSAASTVAPLEKWVATTEAFESASSCASASKPEVTKYWNDEGSEVTTKLEAEINGLGKFEEACESVAKQSK